MAQIRFYCTLLLGRFAEHIGWEYLIDCFLHLLLFLRLLLILVKRLLEGLIIPPCLNVDQEGLVKTVLKLRVQLVVEPY